VGFEVCEDGSIKMPIIRIGSYAIGECGKLSNCKYLYAIRDARYIGHAQCPNMAHLAAFVWWITNAEKCGPSTDEIVGT
jgi:hypothetical protein